eukprot:NODE_19925_length_822_cov_2.143885.p5 GENE.NODE_19925_length_822_cov_2.143885~~NODE_19925_length_822_cov_2.143885.p5  ORF type:complete len:83 (-),score=34.93 NODE_19925_length_822_cov_2.143885:106-354(-)
MGPKAAPCTAKSRLAGCGFISGPAPRFEIHCHWRRQKHIAMIPSLTLLYPIRRKKKKKKKKKKNSCLLKKKNTPKKKNKKKT